MDKSFILFIAGGVIAAYFLLGFLKQLDEEDLAKHSKSHQEKTVETVGYEKEDIVGRTVLDVSSLSEKEQIQKWNQSSLKSEFLYFFPDFEEMRLFVQDHIVGEYLKTKMLESIDKAERDYVGGGLSTKEAKSQIEFLE